MVSLKNIVLATFAGSALACVDFVASINNFQYATITLTDNGQKVCSVNGYGDVNGWRLNCRSGYSAYMRFRDDVVEYSAPHGSWTFATKCEYMAAPGAGAAGTPPRSPSDPDFSISTPPFEVFNRDYPAATMASTTIAGQNSDVRIAVISQPEDFTQVTEVVRDAFGHQARDGVYLSMNPGWDTPEGVVRGAGRMANRFKTVNKNNKGEPNVVFLKATLPDPETAGQRRIVGMAIWAQQSAIEGHGDQPPKDLIKELGLESIFPGNEAEQRYAAACMGSLHKRREEVIAEKATAAEPAVFVLDMCAVDPKFQGKGIAKKLVQWGLDEAKRRGGLELLLEASSMGRHVYSKLGFKQEGPEIEYDVEEQFAHRDRPSNIFMRTGDGQ
ncbi:acetyltransferase [Colletotrichum nymphaeae SA-01]|uniref:Acetyltransferase n=1 Tax=Colletotrichum nymphaeae SA-01 TaxID=1460502 RepID=A0A135SPV3_9PEZI|nr:acetyltransferase [Colletotrichum nymphaeae SA-01]